MPDNSGVLPRGPDPYVCDKFQGINTATSRLGVDEQMCWWMDGFYPLAPNNLRTMPDVGPSLWEAPAPIVFFKGGNLMATPYLLVFLADGSIWAVATNTGGSVQVVPSGTISNPSQTTVDVSQWGSQYILICAQQDNGFFVWDGTLLYQAGTLAPGVVLTNTGSNYTSAPTVTASGGNGSGAAFEATISPTGTVIGVSIDTPNNDYNIVTPGDLTLSVSGGGGSGAQLTANLKQIGFTYQISSITIVNGGAGYSSAPTVTINLAGSSTAITPTTLTAQVATVGVVTDVIMLNPGNGYQAADTVTLNFSGGGGSGAAATVSLMPYGLSGNTLETYSDRVWIANGNVVSFTAPGSVWDTSTAHGGGSFESTDSFLRVGYIKLLQTNGFLYLIGDSSVNYISGVQTSSTSPPTTTFTNQNADPEVGSPWPTTVGVWGQNIVFANIWGAQVSYGSRVSKISEQLDGTYNSVISPQAPGTFVPSAAKANIYGKKVWVLLIPVIDFVTGRNVIKMFLWDGKKWFSTQQGPAIVYIAQQEINSVLTAWGTDGTRLYPLFQVPSSNFFKTLQTKLWATPGGYMLTKTATRFWGLFQYNSLVAPDISLYLDNENSSAMSPLDIQPLGIPVINALGAQIPVINALDAIIVVYSATPTIVSVLTPEAVAQTGVLLGWTITTAAADVSILSMMVQPQVPIYRG